MNDTWIDRNRNVIFIALVLLTLLGIGLFFVWQPTPEPIVIVTPEATPPPTATANVLASPTPKAVRVYVTGAVAHSDVYFLPQGSIIKDAILAAGGVTAQADPERINQALEIKDQQQIHVPFAGEKNPLPPVQGGAPDNIIESDLESAPSQGLLNLNTASLEQLDALPGIGPVIGQRIIDYREQTGEFRAVEEITEVSGIGQATYNKIKTLITVE